MAFSSCSTARRSVSKTSPPRTPREWNTTLGGNGSHVLTAIARDAAGRETTSAPVTVTVANSGSDPAQVGQWSSPTTLPIVPIHTSMLPNGKLLIFDSATNSGTNPRVWDPVARTFTEVPYNDTANLFCAGHTPLADGRILVVGGHMDAYVGLKNATIFDPATNTWSDVKPMANARWYPTLTRLPDGRMLVVSGSSDCPDCWTPGAPHTGIVAAPEIFDPATNNWSTVTGAQPPASSLSQPVRPPRWADLRRVDRGGGDREQGPRPHDQDVERGRQQHPRRRQLCHVPAGEDPEDR